MKAISSRSLFIALAIVSVATANAQYVATLLHRSSFASTSAVGTSGGVQVGYGSITGAPTYRALTWSGTAASMEDVTPSAFSSAGIYDIDGSAKVGWGTPIGNSHTHALLWTGSGSTVIDLHPTTGYTGTQATTTAGNMQGGNGFFAQTGSIHALLWSGTAGSLVDLNDNAGGSFIQGMSLDTQVGYRQGHAALWHGTIASYVDLTPTGFDLSYGSGVSGVNQVGYGIGSATGGSYHALMWSGSAASMVDMNPSGYLFSRADDINGNTQVGSVATDTTGATPHAYVWHGSAVGGIDLHPFLTGLTLDGNPISWDRSFASGVDSNGNIVGSAIDSGGNYYALVWTPVPEPTTMIGLGLGAIALLRRRRRKASQ